MLGSARSKNAGAPASGEVEERATYRLVTGQEPHVGCKRSRNVSDDADAAPKLTILRTGVAHFRLERVLLLLHGPDLRLQALDLLS
jgi:hypothetical protein